MFKKTSMIITVFIIMMSFSACSIRTKATPLPLDNDVESNDIIPVEEYAKNVNESINSNDNESVSSDEGDIIAETENAEETEREIIVEVESDNIVSDNIKTDDANKEPDTESESKDNNINNSAVKKEVKSIDQKKVKSIDQKEVNTVIDPEPESKEKEIILYYSNNEYIMTGDSSLDAVIPVKKTVMVGEKPIEEIVVRELQTEPGNDNLTTSLVSIDILSVDTVDKVTYVNISSNNLAGGSLTESLILQQLVYSLTELDNVEAVQILVDGSKRDSLMGHITIQEPLTR